MSGAREMTITFFLLLVTVIGCHSVPPAINASDEPAESITPESQLEVIVASIDPPLPRPGPELRLAHTELARSSENPLSGLIAMALTGDEAAPETLIRSLGEPERCELATLAIAFLPRRLALPSLWLALRLDCASHSVRATAEALGLDTQVQAAQEAGELPLPDVSSPHPESPDQDQSCHDATQALRDLEPDIPLPPILAGLEASNWSLPSTESDLCSRSVLAAALGLKRGDGAVRLAFDLALDSPEDLPRSLVSFIQRFALGNTSPRLADRVDEADGLICAAMVRAGQIEPLLPVLTDHPEELPRCLVSASRSLGSRDDEAARAALDAIARSGPQPGCGAGALVAAMALVESDEHPPRWTADPVFLGRAIAASLTDRQGRLRSNLTGRLRNLRRTAALLRESDDPPPVEGPVRLLQRYIRAVMPSASGPGRLALERLLADGTRAR